MQSLINEAGSFMSLQILIEGDTELKRRYSEHVDEHNKKLLDNIEFCDAGFDLITPYSPSNMVGSHQFVGHKVNKLGLNVKCAARLHSFTADGCYSVNTGFYMYPRSSISKTCIRLANSVGIIDAGYRGPLIAMVDVVYVEETFINAYDKLFQICAPGLVPIVAEIVDNLGEKTARGEGGFGSTTCK